MGLDTALQCCSVAILRNGAPLAGRAAGMERGHAEHLAPMAASVLAEAGLSVRDLDRIGVVVGPGGFTGVRIALAFARGLVIGTDVKAVGVTSLAALAANVDVSRDMLVAPVLDARRGQVYAALYDSSGAARLAPFVAAPALAAEKLAAAAGQAQVKTVGTGAGLLAPPPSSWRASGAPDQIDAKAVARLAAGAPAPDGPPAPLYLRAPDAKPPSRPPLLGARG
ncbi:MAG: tRNA (adenosine(37)-N6)-threonylcarbamoyltransferase complex dimerization subunit type 1 TsaB [Hyphococcus sp.]